jgi:transcriptional regulator with XRE-family HTH domain
MTDSGDYGRLPAQLAEQLTKALADEGMTQADLARAMGLSPKHVNHMVNGKSGALAMYDFAAFTLGRRWVLTLEHIEGPTDG